MRRLSPFQGRLLWGSDKVEVGRNGSNPEGKMSDTASAVMATRLLRVGYNGAMVGCSFAAEATAFSSVVAGFVCGVGGGLCEFIACANR